jgi:transposase
VIDLSEGKRVWIAAGVTDVRCGFQGLAGKVQTVLEENPLGGDVFIFRGRRGDLVKLLWAVDDGLWLLAKRLTSGPFRLAAGRCRQDLSHDRAAVDVARRH